MEIREIAWSSHAEEQAMLRSDVSREMVEQTVREAEQRFPDPTNSTRTVAHRRFTGSHGRYLVRVIYADQGDGVVVIVTFYRASVDRYWRTDL